MVRLQNIKDSDMQYGHIVQKRPNFSQHFQVLDNTTAALAKATFNGLQALKTVLADMMKT